MVDKKELAKIEAENIMLVRDAEKGAIVDSNNLTFGEQLIIQALGLNNRLLMKFIEKSSSNVLTVDGEPETNVWTGKDKVPFSQETNVYTYAVMIDTGDGQLTGIDGPFLNLEKFGIPNAYGMHNNGKFVILEMEEGVSDKIYKVPSEDGESWVTPK